MDNNTRKKMVLLVDDSKTQLSFFRIHLMRAGFDVTIAENAKEAFLKVFECRPDLILSDVMMPDISGFQFCKIIKNNIVLKKIPVILFSSSVEIVSNVFWAKQAMAEKFISKHSDISDITQLVYDLIEQNPVSDEIKTKLEQNASKASIVLMENNLVSDAVWMKNTVVKECGALIKYIDKPTELIKNAYNMLSMIFPYNLCFLLFNQTDIENTLDLFININHKNIPNDVINTLSDNLTKELFGKERKTNKILQTNNIVDFEIKTSLQDYQKYTTIPVKDGKHIIGAIRFYWTNTQQAESLPYYNDIINFLTHLVCNKVHDENLSFLSYNNKISGIYNKFQLLETISLEFERSNLNNLPFSLALMSFDNYDSIATEYGTDIANAAIDKAVKMIPKSLRFPDKVFRFDHKNLLIILANVDSQKAKIPLERVNSSLDKMKHLSGNNSFVLSNKTIVLDNSFCWSSAENMLNTIVEMQSKLNSENRIVIANEQAY